MEIILHVQVPYDAIDTLNSVIVDRIEEETYNEFPGFGPEAVVHHAHYLKEIEPVDNILEIDPEVLLEVPDLPGYCTGYVEDHKGTHLARMGWKTDVGDFITINYVHPESGVELDTLVDVFIAYTGRRRYFLNESDEEGVLISRALDVLGLTMTVKGCDTTGHATLDFQYDFSYGAQTKLTQLVETPYHYSSSNEDMYWWENQVSYLRRLGHQAQVLYVTERFNTITLGTIRSAASNEVNPEQLTLSTILLDLVARNEVQEEVDKLAATISYLNYKLL